MCNILHKGFKVSTHFRVPLLTAVVVRHKNVDFKIKQQSKFLDKLMRRSSTKRSTKLKDSNATLNSGYAVGLPNLETSKRMAALNKIYFNILNDVICNEEISSLVKGYDVQITHVQVSPDFSAVHVFWIMSPNFDVHEVGEKLKGMAQQIRKFIVNEGILSHVPNVTFVRNKLAFTEMEVCQRLSSLNLSSTDEVQHKIEAIKKRRHLYNLDHEMIYNRIVHAKEKNMGIHRLEDIYKVHPSNFELPPHKAPTALDIDSLRKFLRKRRAELKAKFKMPDIVTSHTAYQVADNDNDFLDGWEDLNEDTSDDDDI